MDQGTTHSPMVKQLALLFAFSFNHHHAEIAIRERLKLKSEGKQALLDKFRRIHGLNEHVVLDTCNRWEIYGLAHDETVIADVWDCIQRAFPLENHQLKSIVSEYRGSAMIQHLFEVSAGVDSQMVGETEILGQVKNAYSDADENHLVDMVLHRVFNKAFQAAKWARTHTSIGRGQVSVGNISVELAGRIFGDLNTCQVLVIGTGEVGRLAAQALKNRNTKSLHFTSRTFGNAQSLATEMGAECFPFENLEDRIHEFDIIVSSTASPHFLLDKPLMKQVMRRRSYRPLFMIDLAMPRDINPEVGKMSQVFLYNLDDVSAIANENLESRTHEIEECKRNLASKAWVTWLEVVRRQKMRWVRVVDENTLETEQGI